MNRIGLCTDSNAQLPPALADRFGIEVVPLVITIDGQEHLEGLDLDADSFYAHCTDGRMPVATISPPSPGQFAAAYEDLLARGCTEILSIHTTAAVCGTLQAARLAVHSTPAPVRLVDSCTFGANVTCGVWAAADTLVAGGSLDDTARAAEMLAPAIGNLVCRPNGVESPFAVTSFRDGGDDLVARAGSAAEAVNAMAAYTVGWGSALRVAVGHSDAATEPIADALEAAVAEAASVVEVVRYRIGPSLGMRTGPGSVACVMFPVG